MNKKKIIIISIAIVAVGTLVVLLLLLRDNKVSYPEEQIDQETLFGGNDTQFDIKELDIPRDDYKLWGVSNTISIDDVGNMAEMLDPTFELTDDGEGEYYYWSNDNGEYFQYSLLNNIFVFNLENGIEWNEVSLTEYSFSTFIAKYLDKDWSYKISEERTFPDDKVIYYANRLTEDGVKIETSEIYNETDYLMFKDGLITGGRILLTEFYDTEVYIPIIKYKDLLNYINLPEYPKEVFFNPTQLTSILSIKDVYLNQEIIEIQNDIKLCREVDSAIVYLYKSLNQSLLTPVIKFNLECTLEYNDEEYSVPARAYVNAVDPEYVKSSD